MKELLILVKNYNLENVEWVSRFEVCIYVRGGLNYIGENNLINYAATGTFTLPAYAIFNASVFYELERTVHP